MNLTRERIRQLEDTAIQRAKENITQGYMEMAEAQKEQSWKMNSQFG